MARRVPAHVYIRLAVRYARQCLERELLDESAVDGTGVRLDGWRVDERCHARDDRERWLAHVLVGRMVAVGITSRCAQDDLWLYWPSGEWRYVDSSKHAKACA